jgi:hypothetical protein
VAVCAEFLDMTRSPSCPALLRDWIFMSWAQVKAEPTFAQRISARLYSLLYLACLELARVPENSVTPPWAA